MGPMIPIVLLATLVAAPALADECDSEARSVEQQALLQGNRDPMTSTRINRAWSLCRQQPQAGQAELNDIRREMELEAARPEPRYGQEPPLGQRWPRVGPGGALD